MIYAIKKLLETDKMVLERTAEETLYCCGNALFPGRAPYDKYHDKIFVREGLTCQMPMETTYYAGKTSVFEDVCFHCGGSVRSVGG